MAREGPNRHISIPKSFSEGNAREWFQRFEICCQANGWNDEVKALKLPTLLEGEALAVWLELSQEEQKDIATAKEKMIQKMVPTEFISLEKFQKRKMLPGEAISLYLHELKMLLDQAMPVLAAEAKQQLLVHQFLAGLPVSVSQQLRATGDTKVLDRVVERAKLLMVVQEQTAATTSEETEVSKLLSQVSQLTEQVAALNMQRKDGEARRCFYCNQPGHTFTVTSLDILSAIVQTDARSEDASHVEDQATSQENAGRETAEGCLQRAAGVPHISKP